MAVFPVILDACVLHPRSLRGLLVELSRRGAYQAKWSPSILEETGRSLRRVHADLTEQKWAAMRMELEKALPAAMVQPLDWPATGLPDRDDAHVVGAALAAHASLIVSFNERDFPPEVMEPMDIEVKHPDLFLVEQMELDPRVACDSVKAILARRKNPPESADAWLDRLRKLGLPRAASMLAYHTNPRSKIQ